MPPFLKLKSHIERQFAYVSDYVPALNKLGARLLSDGCWVQALPLMEKAYRLQPTLPTVSANLAAAYIDAGRANEAWECYRRVIELNNNRLGIVEDS